MQVYSPPPENNSGRLNGQEGDRTYDDERRRASPSNRTADRRRRSRSPPGIDRYIPGEASRFRSRSPSRDRRRSPNSADHYQPTYGTGRMSPPARGGGNIDRYVPADSVGSIRSPPLPADPFTLDHQISYPHFSDWYVAVKDRDAKKPDIQAAYDQYKIGVPGRLARGFVRDQLRPGGKGGQWFRERYDFGDEYAPEEAEDLRDGMQTEETQELVKKKLEKGGLWLETKQKTWVYRREQWSNFVREFENGRFDDLRNVKKLGTNLPLANASAEDTDMGLEDGADIKKEEKEDDDGPDEGEEIEVTPEPAASLLVRDENLFMPTLLFKTISPTVARADLENLVREHIPGFNFLSLGEPNPLKKYHRVGWILRTMESENTLDVVKGLMENINGQTCKDEVRGDFTCHVGVHNAPSAMRRKILPEIMATPAEIRNDLARLDRILKKLEAELGEEFEGVMARILQRAEEHSPVTAPDASADEKSKAEMEILSKVVDIANEYLRRVFSFCMYCVVEADSVHGLTNKCMGGHQRPPLNPSTLDPEYKPDPKSQNWMKSWTDKLDMYLDSQSVDITKLGAKPLKEMIDDEIMENVKQEEEGKHRCRIEDCTKLFKGEIFWRKHVEKRHPEWVKALRKEIRMVYAYVLDPMKVMPGKTDGGGAGAANRRQQNYNSQPLVFGMNGNSQVANGGHVSSQASNSGFVFNNTPGMPMPPFRFDNYRPNPAPPGASPNSSATGNNNMGGIAAPQRGRGGPRDRQYGGPGNRAGPYPSNRDDRNNMRRREEDREARYAASTRDRESRGGGPRRMPPDGAVDGRSIRSYMDLDAPGGKESVPELDY